MRIRTIKPEFWRSDDIAVLPRELRLLFIGLWSYVDDNGVGLDDYRQIAADLFALEEDPKEARDWVREGLATLSRALLVARYEVGGRSLLFIPTWDRHQKIDRPSKERYPRPPDDWIPPTSGDDGPGRHLATVSRQSREELAPGTGEQGNRGTGETSSAAAVPAPKRDPEPRFDEFWKAYPRKVQKDDARKAYREAVRKRIDVEKIISGAITYAQQVRGKDPKYVKYPAGWIRAAGYDDEVIPLARASGGWQPYRDPDESEYFEPMFPDLERTESP